MNNLSEMTVLVTGGTKGIGRGTVESFAKTGATVYGTYLWDDNLDELQLHFSSYPNPPRFLCSDVSDEGEVARLAERIAAESDRIDVLILNAAFAPQFNNAYQLRQLVESIEHNAWPLVTYLKAIEQRFGQYPRYVVAMTSEGHRSCHIPGYDYVAASKAVLEALCRYIGARDDAVIINCISPGVVDTEAFKMVFGERALAFMRTHKPHFVVTAEAVGGVAVALCTGLMDGVRGQVIKVDNGGLFTDNFSHWIAFIDAHFTDERLPSPSATHSTSRPKSS